MSDEKQEAVGVNVEFEMRFHSDHELKEEDKAALGGMALGSALVKQFKDQGAILDDLVEYIEEIWMSHSEDEKDPA